MNKFYCFVLILLVTLCSCTASKNAYNPNKKYPKSDLQKDYSLLRNILEKKHPALYWYTSKDSMNFYFDSLYNRISDSMTELQFGWDILAPLTQKIHCGHTSFSMSKEWNKFVRNRRIPSFPYFVKAWQDTMVVTASYTRKDSIIKRGDLITSINGLRNEAIINKIFDYLPEDGYSENVNYIRISSSFPYLHRNVFGLYKNYRVGYIDSTGIEKTTLVPMFSPVTDTTKKAKEKEKERRDSLPKISRKERKQQRRESFRSLEIDSSINTAIMSLNTFSSGDGRHLRAFFRRSFRTIKEQNIGHLILDLRSNGGGDINMFVLLNKYLRKTPFKVADTSYAIARSMAPYTKYIKSGFGSNIGLMFLTKKQKDGNYHFGYWERHLYKPKSNNHFDGKVYVLINGPTFSASTLLCNSLKGQDNVLMVGEETGGGWHGNSGVMIPDITLPITKLRVRLPFFKLVQYNHVPKDGRGVSPDIFIPPTVEGVRKNLDRKMDIVKAMIKDSTIQK